MTSDMLITLGLLALAIFFFVTERLRVDVVALSVVVALLVTGILDTGEALSGFSTSAVLTVASLFIVGGAVLRTGLAAIIGDNILRLAGTSEQRLIFVIMLAVAAVSGFISSTGTVAVLLPAIISLSNTSGISKSRLLIPLAFGSLLGGAVTLIGTPPNIIVNDLLRDANLPRFEFFSFTPIGGLLIIIGVLFMTFIGRLLLPKGTAEQPRPVQRVNTPEDLWSIYRLPDNLYRLRIRSRSPLIGKTLAESGLGSQFGLSILGVQRPVEARASAPVMRRITPMRDTVLQHNDILLAKAASEDVNRASAQLMLGLQPAGEDDQQSLISNEVGIAEVIIPLRSTLEDKTLVDVRFGRTYRLTVLNIFRPGTDEPLDLKTTPLRVGDTLLVQGAWKDIAALKKLQNDFIVIGETEQWTNGAPSQHKAPVAFAIVVSMIALMISGIVSITAASMLAGLAMVISGCLTMDEAYSAIDWKSIVLIAGMWPLSIALEKVGLVAVVANGFIDALGGAGPLAVMAGLFALTALFTQVLSNTTTTVIVAPIALVTAQALDVQPQPFLMTVAIAASMAFATPVATPVNTLVMGPGEYSFRDFASVGIPMIVLMMLATLALVPILFPL